MSIGLEILYRRMFNYNKAEFVDNIGNSYSFKIYRPGYPIYCVSLSPDRTSHWWNWEGF